MADANLKPRRTRFKPTTRIPVVLADASGQQQHRPAFPWMQITDAFLEQFGFLPSQRVLFSINPGHGQIIISLDRDYTNGGQPMTESQIDAALRRRNRPG
jgi:hypothetical protein